MRLIGTYQGKHFNHSTIQSTVDGTSGAADTTHAWGSAPEALAAGGRNSNFINNACRKRLAVASSDDLISAERALPNGPPKTSYVSTT